MKKFIKILMLVLLVITVTLTSIFYKNIGIKKYIKENNSFDLINVNNYDVFLLEKLIPWPRVINSSKKFSHI